MTTATGDDNNNVNGDGAMGNEVDDDGDGATGNEVDDDGDGVTGDDNEDDNDDNGDGAMGSGATGYDDDNDDDGRRQATTGERWRGGAKRTNALGGGHRRCRVLRPFSTCGDGGGINATAQWRRRGRRRLRVGLILSCRALGGHFRRRPWCVVRLL